MQETKVFQVKGMTCSSCEMKIERMVGRIEGVSEVKTSLAKSEVKVGYDPEKVNSESIIAAILKLGYEVGKDGSGTEKSGWRHEVNQLLGIGIILFAVFMIIKSTVGFNFIPQVDKSVGYGMLFVIGLLTSLHCIAMCGGINLSQCISANQIQDEKLWPKFKPSLLYNSGRVISYTLLGGIVGAIGSAVSFSGPAKGIVAVVGGIFMVVIGINMLGIFPWLKRFKISTPKFFGAKIHNSASKRNPFIIGLLNGLMPCGPLQTMQLYALGTGSFFAGAASMFLFSLGTVPLMFGFGAVSSLLSSKFTHRMLKVSAVLVIILGLVMVNRGLGLSGVSIAAPVSRIKGSSQNVARIQGNVQVVTTNLESGSYPPFTVQKGIPVKWILKAKPENLNGCNGTVTIPRFNIQKKLVPGDNIIEFTPDAEGTIPYTCWMGMINSTITVVADVTKISIKDKAQLNNSAISSANAQLNSGSCCSAGTKATKFRGGQIPTDSIQIAKVVNGIQEVTIKVNDEGYSPAVAVVQKGMKAKIKFISEKINSCNYLVVFPEYRGQLDLSQGQTETPAIDVVRDFTFQCGMGMLHGYVKAVDNLNKVDLKAVKQEVEAYRPPAGSGGCCGG